MFESQKFIVKYSSIALIVVAFLISPIHSNQTSNGASTPVAASASGNVDASAIVTTPDTGPEDEPNGDDGSRIKQDMQNIEDRLKSKTATDVQKPHTFYEPRYIADKNEALKYWVDFSNLSLSQNMSTKHEMLSKSHRRAAPIKLSFDFPFYGQPLKNIIIATGGFLYVGEHLHHWLAATQNISPLMANFNLNMTDYSDIHHYDNGTSLVVQWKDVQLKDNKPPGNFSFQVTLHKNGDIVFVYHTLPAPISSIPDEEHPVKVGISDAFVIDKIAFFIRRKTIYDYHRLNLRDQSSMDIKSGTAVYLKALPTCNQFDGCEKCSSAPSNLDCIWCPAVKRCSNGFDRKRHEWLAAQCDKITSNDCSKKDSSNASKAQAGGAAASDATISVDSIPNSARQMLPGPGPNGGGSAEGRSREGSLFMTLLLLVAVSSGIGVWVVYAYNNPSTPSGQLLIKYRPSNWRWQNAETRYTAASIHM